MPEAKTQSEKNTHFSGLTRRRLSHRGIPFMRTVEFFWGLGNVVSFSLVFEGGVFVF